MKKLRFGHLSDSHLMDPNDIKGEVSRKLLAAGGDPLASLTTALEELREEKPDFLILTGDLCHEGGEGDYDALRRIIDSYLPGVPRLAALGNHDVREAFRKGFLQDKKGGDEPYFDALEIGGVRIISLDTAWEKKLYGTLDEEQLDMLEETLKRPVREGNILIFHHPVCQALEKSGMELSPRFERLMRGGRVIGIFNGHVHRHCSGWAAGIPHFTAQSLAFDIEVRQSNVYYTTRGGYSMCELDENGEFFVEGRITTPKGVIFHTKTV